MDVLAWLAYTDDDTEPLDLLCEAGKGYHYESDEWKQLADQGDWTDSWPVVDSSGNITGVRIDTFGDRYASVDGEVAYEPEANEWKFVVDGFISLSDVNK
jgi:hypothetical protein